MAGPLLVSVQAHEYSSWVLRDSKLVENNTNVTASSAGSTLSVTTSRDTTVLTGNAVDAGRSVSPVASWDLWTSPQIGITVCDIACLTSQHQVQESQGTVEKLSSAGGKQDTAKSATWMSQSAVAVSPCSGPTVSDASTSRASNLYEATTTLPGIPESVSSMAIKVPTSWADDNLDLPASFTATFQTNNIVFTTESATGHALPTAGTILINEGRTSPNSLGSTTSRDESTAALLAPSWDTWTISVLSSGPSTSQPCQSFPCSTTLGSTGTLPSSYVTLQFIGSGRQTYLTASHTAATSSSFSTGN
ncbi:hypothetical protein MPH_13883, partial [Macrophomina phaseolina MS6]